MTVITSTKLWPCPMPNASPEFGVLVRVNPRMSWTRSPTDSDETTIAFETWSRSTTAPQTRRARRQPRIAAGLSRPEVTRG